MAAVAQGIAVFGLTEGLHGLLLLSPLFDNSFCVIIVSLNKVIRYLFLAPFPNRPACHRPGLYLGLQLLQHLVIPAPVLFGELGQGHLARQQGRGAGKQSGILGIDVEGHFCRVALYHA